MGKKFALDLSNSDVIQFMEEEGISPEEVSLK
jgi:hypothetical protein